MRRRDFCISLPLALAASTGGLLPACARRRPLRVLILGGTGFVGPHLTRAAIVAGHDVSLFNRGVTNPEAFPELELLIGNRYPDRDAGLSALEGVRTWDAVIDTWQEAPGCIDATTRMLADRVGRYVYVSSIATYRSFRAAGMTEDSSLRDAAEHIATFDSGLGYPTRKRAGEQAAEQVFGERATVLRCTSIQGRHERGRNANNEAGYWPYRFLTGAVMLAPDDPTAAFQLIDVKDMADFAVRCIERGYGGAYNLVGPEESLLLREYLEAWREAAGNRSRIVWVDPEWLLRQEVRPFDDIPNWIPASDPEPGFYRLSNEKSIAHGLTYRPLGDTLVDAVAGVRNVADLVPSGPGLSRERELELIASWQATVT